MDKGDIFTKDAIGRTTLFYAAEKGNIDEVERIIFSLSGTGLSIQRLSLITIKDKNGLTASDIAEKAGYKEIAKLLRKEQGRMEFFE